MPEMVILGTRKGSVVLDRKAGGWAARPIAHAGIPVCYAARDPRDGTLWASLDHGHWGPKLSRSRDGGQTWSDISALKYPAGARYIVKYLPTPDFDPAAPAAAPEYKDATVFKIWNIAFGHADQPGDSTPVRSPAGCSAATTAATVGNSTGPCGATTAAVATCLPVTRPARTAGRHAGQYRLRRIRTGDSFDRRRPAQCRTYRRRGIVGRRHRDDRRRPDLGRPQPRYVDGLPAEPGGRVGP